MKILAPIVAAGALLLCSCSSLEQQELQSWLNSPTTQSELASMQNFAFDILMSWVESNVSVKAGVTAAPDFSGIEPAAIAAVEKKFDLNPVQAAYVVHQAESQMTAGKASASLVYRHGH